MPTKLKFTNSLITSLKPEKGRYDVYDTEVSGLHLRVTPAGVKTYSVRYRNLEGNRPRYTIGKHGSITLKQARDIAKKKLAVVSLGGDPQADKLTARKKGRMPTLKQFLDDTYLPWFESHYRAGTTRASFNALSDFNKIPLDRLTLWNIEKWRSKRRKEGVQAGTVNRPVLALRAALNRAVEWSVLDENPIKQVKAIQEDILGKPRYLTSAEEKRLRKALGWREDKLRDERDSANKWRRERGYSLLPDLKQVSYADHIKPMVLLSMNTGMRQGEVFNLEWKNVDLKKGLVTVVGRSAKSGRTRHIPLNEEALGLLRAWRNLSSRGSNLVFPNSDGKAFNNVKKAWAGVLEKAKIKEFRWHDLRHHFASRLVMAGVDLNTVRELLGHSDIKMTLRYTHLAPEHKAEAVSRLVSSC